MSSEGCRFLYLLLNDEVRSLTFSGGPDKENSLEMMCITDTWIAMTNKCTGLQKLVCKNSPDFHTDPVGIFHFALEFVELRELDVNNVACRVARLRTSYGFFRTWVIVNTDYPYWLF